MMERKFTDDEIVKALECCREKDCGDCPMSEYPQTICEWDAFDLAIDLINRKKAEIERLKKDNEYILMQHAFQRRPSGDCWNDVIEKAKSEAIKEFAERLKQYCAPVGDFGDPCGVLTVTDRWIDHLVKEMTGENNGN